jgi:thermitase
MINWRSTGVAFAALVLIITASAALSVGGAAASPPHGPAADVVVLDTGRVIVKFQPGVPAATQSALHRRLNASVAGQLGSTGMVVVEIANARATQAVAAAYARNPNVVFAEPDALVPLADTGFTPDDPLYSNQWQHPATDSALSWGETTGSNEYLITICDTGISGHEDLADNVLWNYSLNTASGNWDASPVHPHGTFVAGMAAAVGDNGLGVAGVAHKAGIVPVRISNSSNGSAFISDMAECILYGSGEPMFGRELPGPSTAINLSYQTYSNGNIFPSLLTAAGTATSRGSLVVFAAGNENTNPVGNADPEEILYVASIDSDGTRSSFSNYGSFIDIAAPGRDVLSTYVEMRCNPVHGCSVTSDHVYAYWSGTSFAAPMVAGAALLVQANAGGTLDPMGIKAALIGGACETGDPDHYGAGILNTNNAVRGQACGGTSEPELTLVSIYISANGSTDLEVGDTLQFTATGHYDDDSSAEITNDVEWHSDDARVTINEAGFATAEAAGTAVITASLDGVTSDPGITVNVTEPTLESIEVSPSGLVEIDEGGTIQFTATGTYSNETTRDITTDVTWASNDSSVSINASGLATGYEAGDAIITASLDGFTSNEVTITVNEPPPPGTDPLVALSDLGSVNNGSTWTARVSVSVMLDDKALDGVTVSYRWNSGAIQTCTTGDANGGCDVLSQGGILKRVGSVTLTVTKIDGVDYEPAGSENSITVYKP